MLPSHALKQEDFVSDRNTADQNQSREMQRGTLHYNPGNMAGKPIAPLEERTQRSESRQGENEKPFETGK
jgi:hypothetical protein